MACVACVAWHYRASASANEESHSRGAACLLVGLNGAHRVEKPFSKNMKRRRCLHHLHLTGSRHHRFCPRHVIDGNFSSFFRRPAPRMYGEAPALRGVAYSRGWRPSIRRRPCCRTITRCRRQYNSTRMISGALARKPIGLEENSNDFCNVGPRGGT